MQNMVLRTEQEVSSWVNDRQSWAPDFNINEVPILPCMVVWVETAVQSHTGFRHSISHIFLSEDALWNWTILLDKEDLILIEDC
jgi:hypothetical protein